MDLQMKPLTLDLARLDGLSRRLIASRSTALALRARGFDARYLAGGVEAWRAAGLPVQPPGGVR